MARWQPEKYPGRLGKVTRLARSDFLLLDFPERLGPVTQSPNEELRRLAAALRAGGPPLGRKEWKKAIWPRLFTELFRHYSISSDDPMALAKLAIRLAEAQVPAFTFQEDVKPGPKTKSRGPGESRPRPRGRPRKHTDESDRILLAKYHYTRESLRIPEGRGAVKSTVEAVVTSVAAERGISKERLMRTKGKKLQKDISNALSRIRKIP
jgi:hypothetical protein